jgi:ribosomal protein S20
MSSKAERVNLRNKARNRSKSTKEKNLKKKFLNSLENILNNPEDKKKTEKCFSCYISRISKNRQSGLMNRKKAARIQRKTARIYKNASARQEK